MLLTLLLAHSFLQGRSSILPSHHLSTVLWDTQCIRRLLNKSRSLEDILSRI
jgi:hypothetical protein